MLRRNMALALPLLFGSAAYHQRVLNTDSDDLHAYWRLKESTEFYDSSPTYSSPDIVDSSPNAFTGTYTGVTLAQIAGPKGGLAPLWDGVNDTGNVYSAGLAGVFDIDEVTILAWARVSAAGVWTDGVNRRVFYFGESNSNRLFVFKSTGNNQISFQYQGGGSATSLTAGSITTTGWFSVLLSVSESADEFKAYINGVQVGTTQTGLTAAVGSIASNLAGIGSTGTGAQYWDGYLSDVVVWNGPATPERIALGVA